MRRIALVSTLTLMLTAAANQGCGDDSSSGQNNQQVDAAVTEDAAQTVDGATTNDAAATEDAAQTSDGATTGDAAQNQDAAQSGDGGQNTDSGTQPDELGFGSACECQGSTCDQMGIPVPNGGDDGTIVGCDHVDQPWTGADLVCLRTYTGDLAAKTYFANGYCGLMATKCTGSSTICDSAVFGDYDNMTACPAGTVMIQDTRTVSVFTMNATIDSKTCVKACSGGTDECREGELDPIDNNNPTQYQCINKDGVQFCYDPRDLTDQYTATQF